jgi:hypothetical protein
VNDNAKRVQALIDLQRSVEPVRFLSIDRQTYTVVVRPYIWKPTWNRDKTKLSVTCEVTLDQVEI